MIFQLQIVCITSDWIWSASGNNYLFKSLSEYSGLLKFPSSGSKASVGIKYTQYISFQRTLKKKSLYLGGGAVVPFLLTRVLTNIRSLADKLEHQKNNLKKAFWAMWDQIHSWKSPSRGGSMASVLKNQSRNEGLKLC